MPNNLSEDWKEDTNCCKSKDWNKIVHNIIVVAKLPNNSYEPSRALQGPD